MTSKQTTQECVKIIKKHVDLEQAIELFEELCRVEGNESFRRSVRAMRDALKEADGR